MLIRNRSFQNLCSFSCTQSQFPIKMIISILFTFILYVQAKDCVKEIDYKKEAPALDQRILNGFNVEDGMYPFVAAILEFNRHLCGATILSPKFVITAGHCVEKNTSYMVMAGSVDLQERGVRKRVERVILHPNYNFNNGREEYDIGIVELQSPLPLIPDKISVVRVPSRNDKVPKQFGVILGWGDTNPLGHSRSNILLAARVFKEKCKVEDYYFCIGHPYENRQPCFGDAGGPFTINGILYGIISHNLELDCTSGFPSVLVNVPYFSAWIQSITKLP